LKIIKSAGKVQGMSEKYIDVYVMRTDEYSRQIGRIERVLADIQSCSRMIADSTEGLALTESIDLLMTKGKDQPVNRMLLDDEGRAVMCLYGDLVCVKHNKGVLVSLSAEDIELIEQRLKIVLGEAEDGYIYLR
jgi:hypothetical protein